MIENLMKEIEWNESRLKIEATSHEDKLLVKGRLEALNWVLRQLPEEG